MRALLITAFLCMQAASVWAEEISPWFGADGQKPFQIQSASATTDDVTTQSTSKPDDPCNIAGCPKESETAITTEGLGDQSQN
jgi:hypothetical protein